MTVGHGPWASEPHQSNICPNGLNLTVSHFGDFIQNFVPQYIFLNIDRNCKNSRSFGNPKGDKNF